MRILIGTLGAVFLVSASANVDAQRLKDPPWNPEHIDHLPLDVRSVVMTKCTKIPNAGHYFATYFHNDIHLHYEHLHCDTASFCTGSQCLHEVYKLTAGHYRLAKRFFGSGND